MRRIAFRDQKVMLLSEEIDVTEAPRRAVTSTNDQRSIVKYLVTRSESLKFDAKQLLVDCSNTKQSFGDAHGVYKILETKTAGRDSGSSGKALQSVLREAKLLMSSSPHPNVQDLEVFAVAYDRLFIMSRACDGE